MALAQAISRIGQPSFYDALLKIIDLHAGHDSALVVLYSRRRRPLVLMDRLANAERTNSAERYINGAYLLDPFYQISRKTKSIQLVRMADIKAIGFDETDYFVSYYKASGVEDEINYLVPLADGRVCAIAIERSQNSEEFSDQEILELQRIVPVISALVLKHLDILKPAHADAKDDKHERLEVLLKQFGSDVLTPRECEVVHLMLNGYSMLAIGNLLSVSVETVRVHRRNIYEKLQISSLAELFSLALKAIYGAKTQDN